MLAKNVRALLVAVPLLVLAVTRCSSSDSNGAGGDDAGEDATTCNPFPETFTVTTDTDCVAIVPNPCCAAFVGFSCAQQGDAGGMSCSETDTCVRASRYDTTLCGGGSAYSCPLLNGDISATLLSPPCVQMETIGPAGEGVRWCCGGNVTAPNLDAGQQPSEDGGKTTVVDAGKTSTVDASKPPTDDDAGTAIEDAALD